MTRRLFHTGPEGGLWSLVRAGSGLAVLHEPGGGATPARIGLPDFLAGPDAPERRALTDLIGSLIDAGAPPVTGAAPEAGAAAAEPSPGEEAV